MENFAFGIFRLLQFVEPLIWAGCCIMAIIKFRGRLSATLAGIGFGLVSLTGILFMLSWHVWGIGTFLAFFEWLKFIGILLVLGSIICLRFQARGSVKAKNPVISQYDTASALSTNAHATNPPATSTNTTTVPSNRTLSADATISNAPEKPLRQPGWGLVSAWLALSAVNWLLGLVLFVLIIEAGSYINSREWEGIALVGIANLLVTIPAIIVFLIWIYQSWDSISPNHRSISPGKAVGFLFIPFFSLYWLFRVIPGLSAAIRRSRESHGSQPIGSAGYGVGIAACVIAIIPYIGIFSWPFFLIWIILANKDKNLMLLEQQPAATQGQEIHVVAGTV